MKIKTAWNLKLLYKSDDDPQIEKDLMKIERTCLDFERKYRDQPFTASPEALAKVLREIEELDRVVDGQKPWWYFTLKTHLNSEDTRSAAKATKYAQRITQASNRIKFFGLAVAKIPTEDQKKFLTHPALEPYIYDLTKIFNNAKFLLSEGEEQLNDLLSQTSYTMWVDTQERLLNQQTIKHKGVNIPIVKALGQLADLPKKEREEVYLKISLALKSISYLSEGELNAVYNYKKLLDERRGFEKPYSATILSYENDERSIENFVSLISKHFKIAHRFYALHAKLLGQKKLTLADRNVNIGKIKTKFDFPTSVSILRSIFGQVDKEYLTLFDKFLANGQIDTYPKKGKRGGAYCWGMLELPTFLLLNHVNDVRSLETLAHEFGHAIHTELSKQQPPRYQGYSTATAEVASTFFEQLVSTEIESYLPAKEKITLLHNKIMGDISTIFRQIACFNFELELHERIRKAGQVAKEEIASLMLKHLKSYLGPAVTLSPNDGYFFVYWSHIRKFFYVYTYAYGQIISRALYEKWQKNPKYATEIKKFLSAGGSMSPEAIFKSIGIDTSRASFFETGLRGIERDIERLQKLYSRF